MTEQIEKKEYTLQDASCALTIVEALIANLQIPAARAQEFALVNTTLVELKVYVESLITQAQAAPETATPVDGECATNL